MGDRRWGCTIVEQLGLIGALGRRFVGAHGVWLQQPEIARLAASGSAVVHNPASNLRLGVGIAPVRELLEAGTCVALGTDGSLSSDNQNMFESMRFAALLSRVRIAEPEKWFTAAETWQLATTGGAAACGHPEELGRIEPGKADLVLLRADSPYLRPLNDPLNALVFAETGAAVDTVLADGRVVVREGRVLGVDEGAIRDRAQAAVERLAASNRGSWELAEALAPYVAQACGAALASPATAARGGSLESA